MNWHRFRQSLYISPYPSLTKYIAHYVIDLIIVFVLILWIYKPSKCCTRIPRDSIIALVCCVCIIEDAINDTSLSQSETSIQNGTKNYNKICYDKVIAGVGKEAENGDIFDLNTPNTNSERMLNTQYGIDDEIHDDITKLSIIQSQTATLTKSMDNQYINNKLVDESVISSNTLSVIQKFTTIQSANTVITGKKLIDL